MFSPLQPRWRDTSYWSPEKSMLPSSLIHRLKMSFVLSESGWSGSWLRPALSFWCTFQIFSSEFQYFPNNVGSVKQQVAALCICCFFKINGIRKANILLTFLPAHPSTCWNVLEADPNCAWCWNFQFQHESMNISSCAWPVRQRVIEWTWVVKDHHEGAIYIIKSHMYLQFHLVISFSAAEFWSLVIIIAVTVIWPMDVHSLGIGTEN